MIRKIVFMGTADFAVPSLDALLKAGFEVPVVVTVPDKPAGRGKKPKPSPVKDYALKHDLPVLQPEKLKDPGFIRELEKLNADCYVVVAFRILPEKVFAIPEFGTINLHASLLPSYRGAAPIQRAIMNGEQETGATTFLIDPSVDTGNILLQCSTSIEKNETAGELHDRLMVQGADLVVETVQKYPQELKPRAQQEGNFPHAPKITKEDAMIDWTQDAYKVHNQIRGLSPVPGAWCWLDNKRLKILKTSIKKDTELSPGELKITPNQPPVVGTGSSESLYLDQVKPEGRKELDGAAFVRGYNPEGKQLKSPGI